MSAETAQTCAFAAMVVAFYATLALLVSLVYADVNNAPKAVEETLFHFSLLGVVVVFISAGIGVVNENR